MQRYPDNHLAARPSRVTPMLPACLRTVVRAPLVGVNNVIDHIYSTAKAYTALSGLALVISLLLPLPSIAANVNLATAPLANATTTSVLPNVMFILDDSGSMDWNFLPDWARDNLCKSTTGTYNASCINQPPYRSSDFNGVYYNPAIYYKPAVNADGTSKASQTSWTSVKNDAYNVQSTSSTNLVTGYADVEWCTDSAYTDCLRNDNYILPGTVNGKTYTTSRASVKSTGSGSVATGSVSAPTTAARFWGPHYYTIVPGEYCDTPQLTNCQITQTATFSYPAKVRWCNSSANATAATPAAGVCQGVRTGAYTVARYPTKFFTPAIPYSPAVAYAPPQAAVAPSNGTLGITAVDKNKTISLKCGATFIGKSAAWPSSNSNTASTRLNSLYTDINGTTINGYTTSCTRTPNTTSPTSLSCSISAPAGASACSGGFTVDSNITTSTNTGPSGGSNAVAEVPAQPEVPAQAAGYPGSFVRTDIVTSVTSYPKASARTDCAGATCTYAEEMTNFANWWTYYQTRMQAMKSAASLAFKAIDNRYRVGYSSINNNTGSDFLNIAQFNATQKTNWYAKLFAANPNNSTPLRTALSNVGRLYAGKLTTFNSVTAADPMQYSCQQNFTILSTDGYWNGGGGVEVDGSTAIGNFDGGTTPRPMYEGGTASSNSLADAAKYYYDTDLRTPALSNCTGALGLDVCDNNVFVSGTDNNVKQHMTSFTLGLGVDGTLFYTSDYKTATSGDYFDIKNGTKNWSVPAADSETAVDDLWHAAVNGQGTYFSAKNPDQLTSGLSAALAAINSKVGAGAAAATSTLNPVTGDNFAYVASYTTVKWTGNVEARSINVSTGVVSEAATWCAEDIVAASCAAPSSIVADTSGSSTIYNCVTPGADTASCPAPGVLDGTNCKVEVPVACSGTMAAKVGTSTDTRKIWMKSGSSLTDFTYANLSAAQQTNFNSAFLSANLSQWSLLTSTQQTVAAGDNLVKFLRGQNGFEDRASNVAANRLYRYREAVLGDAVESTPAYVAKPTFSYTDPGYSAFKTAQASRAGTVYMGTNDGMLHAFNGSNGLERWAYVPSMVIPNMWRLADKNYSTMHIYYVNGDPIISDICTSSCSTTSAVWRTILVAGLNGGGRGYYALDITDPATPSLLWEFDTTSDNDLGYTFGNPVITKKSDGTWVVLVTSGYNNTTGSNPGKGFLYVLNAVTGAQTAKIPTGVGDATTPSGLARIVSYVDDAEKNNTATYTYGGDLLGNLWRFDINAAASSTNPLLFATLKDALGNAQPITTRPELGKINNKRVVFVGTGKYLETTDLTDTQQQTLYAIKDDNATTTLVNPRTTLVEQTLTTVGATRTATNNAVDFTTGLGWFVNFPDSGERQNVAGQLVLGTLLIPTTVPSNTVCSPGGYSWLNYFNYKTGGGVIASGTVSSKTNAPIVGVNVYYINKSPVVSVVTADHPTPELIPSIPFSTAAGGFQGKRVIWRELMQ